MTDTLKNGNNLMHRGYVKLWRRSIDSRVFKNPELLKVWLWCLMKANHETAWVEMKSGKSKIEIKVEPGQFFFGRKSASKELGMKESSVRNRIKKLENMQNVDIKADRQYSIVSIINWDIYQQDEKKEDSKEDRQRTGKGQAKDTNKNDKNDKNKRKQEKKVEKPSNGDGKTAYREYVKLTTKQYERLISDFGKTKLDWMMDLLDRYIGAMPKKRNKYEDHNRVLRDWPKREYEKKHPELDEKQTEFL